MESIHLSGRADAQPDHINRLVEMVVDFHSLIIGHSYGLIDHRPEFLVPGIPKCIRKLSRVPVFTSVSTLVTYSIKYRLKFLYIVL